jgi:hypothetical protein
MIKLESFKKSSNGKNKRANRNQTFSGEYLTANTLIIPSANINAERAKSI